MRSLASSVSCPSQGVCSVVGRVGPYPNGPDVPLVEQWAGGSWSVLPTPSTSPGQLVDVSCSAITACTAVGYTERADLAAEAPLHRCYAGARASRSCVVVLLNGTRRHEDSLGEGCGNRPTNRGDRAAASGRQRIRPTGAHQLGRNAGGCRGFWVSSEFARIIWSNLPIDG